MIFCVFSFNRGRFLENCVRSIEQCVPDASIIVFDDDSNDPATQEVLSDIDRNHQVLKPGNVSTHKLGGLYGNMQSALEYCSEASTVCFLQDDMQVVRPLSAEEIGAIEARFDADEALAFIQPCFLKGSNRERNESIMAYDEAAGLYFRAPSGQSAGRYFSAVSITRPQRLLSKGWQFARSEPENDRQAQGLFGRMGHLFAPFAMWLPEVPAYRGKKKTLALRIAEKRRACGLYPFQIMSSQAVEAMYSRSAEVLPVAEDFVTCENDRLPKPWCYYPMQGSRWLKKLNTLELALRRLLSGAR
jgi:glycosyltransferase involved in cell wall biosynthesis